MKIKCLLVMPNKEVQKVKIPGNIKFIKSLIGDNLLRIRTNKNNLLLLIKMLKTMNLIDFFRVAYYMELFSCFNKK